MFTALLATLLKGFLIGLEQTDAGWGWLSVPIATISAVPLLVPDVLMLANGQYASLVVLPWTVWGLLIGTVIGYFDRGEGGFG
ncbi:hypothetical protein EER27_14260 [Lysobacter psychrotolerans]|uniref:Uncharacterized protein n=1 Tax=Montanilutibacter psychrotolerans TaxID=1327343 RepID=A0A3M8ST46_9GAMM|nr:hypothetical protein EER27_14260 [Lysobacter psychrotolerans]